jgi:hypothetical protein
MQDRPTAAELLGAVATYLEDELMPTLDGPLAYRTRVAANLVRTLERDDRLAQCRWRASAVAGGTARHRTADRRNARRAGCG